MKNILFIFSLLLSPACFAQTGSSILLLPLKSGSVEIQGKALKILRRDSVSPDSLKHYILLSSINKLHLNLPEHKIIMPENNVWYKVLRDSTPLSYQRNTSQTRKIEASQGFQKMVNASDDSERNKYYGRDLQNNLEVLKLLMKENNCKYVLFLNKFELRNKRIFSHHADLVLHVEIYDENATKIYSDKLIWEHSLSKKMKFILLPYFIRNAFDDFYSQVQKHIH